MQFDSFFDAAFPDDETRPYPYQRRLAEEAWPDLLDIPTGMGKTAAVTLAWLFKRGWRAGTRAIAADENTPRRLVWCLPMRVLVEQTQSNILNWLLQLGINDQIRVQALMGGEDDVKTWAENAEQDTILIGTQDMLLSRALMRGYGMSRYQWPVHFALLHNDCLWAFDEVQLMGAGLATSAQLDAFRRSLPLGRGSRSLWLSATLQREWLATVDLQPHLNDFVRLGLGDDDRTQAGERLNARKALSRAELAVGADATKKAAGLKHYAQAMAQLVMQHHDTSAQTLVIVNRVDRAQAVFEQLRAARPQQADLLIHARFRSEERAAKNRSLCETRRDRIIVATQAIEAGVDISSQLLITELAPWSSMVQRFGRCNRFGEYNPADGGQVLWVDIDDDADPLPYTTESLQQGREHLAKLHDVSPASLPAPGTSRPLIPVLRRKDLLDLFNTDPDLSGFDVDISGYIRDSDTPGLQAFWRDFSDPNQPVQTAPQRRELCPVGIGQAKNLHKNKAGAWRWDSLAGEWQRLRNPPRPGMTLMLASEDGGYDPTLGFDATSKTPVESLPPLEQDNHETFDQDWRSRSQVPVALDAHLQHAAAQARLLCKQLGETTHTESIVRASRWHDIGKAHEIFQASMHRCEQASTGLLAKSNCDGPMRHQRAHFRHELASALAWLNQHDRPEEPDPMVDLIAYLIAAHHGKVRMSLRAMPNEPPAANDARFARGIWEGDVLPELRFDGEHSEKTTLRLALMEMGEGEQGRSWSARTLSLLEDHGPFQLAWLETLVRLADWRASAKEQAETSDA